MRKCYMVQCDKCGKEAYMPFRCNYCGGYFCEEHRLPEFHECSGLYKQTRNSTHDYAQDSSGFFRARNARIKKPRYWFSNTELRNLVIALLIIISIPIVWLRTQIFRNPTITLGAVIVFALAFLLHELAHKFMAQRLGYWAEFRLNQLGLVITLLSFLSPLKIVAPGAVMISGVRDWNDYGKISISGPVTNIVQGLIFLMLYLVGVSPIMGYIGMIVNSSLALFNLIPFGVFDGAKIMKWNWINWLLSFLTALGIYLYAVIIS
jgi:Zn-dependent protease